MRRLLCVLAPLLIVACRSEAPPPPAPATAPSASSTPAAAASAVPSAAAIDGEAPVRVRDVVEHPEWDGRVLTIDVYDDLIDAEHYSLPKAGEYGVMVEDVSRNVLLVPGTMAILPKKLVPPLRIVAKVSQQERVARLAVESIATLDWPTPERVTAERLVGHIGRNGRFVQLEGEWRTGFEASSIESIWITVGRGATWRCEPKRKYEPGRDSVVNRVRVTGMAYGQSRGYGHLGAYPATLLATDIVFLGNDGKECQR